jgi:NCS1 family nucleobase:cation symporter-1
VSYFLGIAAQIPFLAQKLYTGPVTKALDGADISWIIGLIVTTTLYLPWARRTTKVPDQVSVGG